MIFGINGSSSFPLGLQLVTGVDAVLTDLQRERGDLSADAWSVLKQHLRAKYGAAVKELSKRTW